ncbi:MAG: molybdopterin cofactor-binding domain-containing protein [Pseudomonadota bacterium]
MQSTSNLLRLEDPQLLTGRGKFFDDVAVGAEVLHAAILRSPHAHAAVRSIDISKALALPGVAKVVVGADLQAVSSPLMVGVKIPITCWPMAVEKARYVGEPAAVALAVDRYVAEDALDLIDIDWSPLPPVVDPEDALSANAAVLHQELGGNLGAERSFDYGDVEAAFATSRRIEVKVSYPRNSCTPIETYGVLADFDPHDGTYDITANFQGPFSIHPVIARALQVPGHRLRLRTPEDSGGSFGVKQGVFPYIVLMAVASRLAGRPVKWVEDRLEHLTASVSATNRVIRLAAAVAPDGKITALDWDQIEDVGAYLRAPEPATLYRMHGNLTGAYQIPNLRVRNRIVMTSKTPTGLNRGFGGPQVYFALERLMQRIAIALHLDPLDVIRRNLIPDGAFPYQTASGATYDSGDYGAVISKGLKDGRYDELIARRDAARAEGQHYGIGLATVVEPSVSNMGYLSTALTAEERARAGPKNGAQSSATLQIDPVGGVSVQIDSLPQGQGHRTVAAQVVAEVLGIDPDSVQVISTLDTAKDAWSIASGNYASRFAAASAGAVKLAAETLKTRLSRIAAAQLNAHPDGLVFKDGRIALAGNPDTSVPFARIASAGHWAPATLPQLDGDPLRETARWTAPELTAPTDDDQINSSLCHAFIFDFCGVEIDAITGDVRIDRYVTTHDCGRILHDGMVEGQIRGGFMHGVGATLLEEYAYGPDGAFLAGTFADYPVPTVNEMPELQILHVHTPSPVTPLGAKGVGEGNCMSTPVCIANAVADALAPTAGAVDLALPLTPARIAPFLATEPAASTGQECADPGIAGDGSFEIEASPQAVWELLMNPAVLAALIPGAHAVKKTSTTTMEADVTIGVGPVKGRYRIEMQLSELSPPNAVTLSGLATGALGHGQGSGHLSLRKTATGTEVAYDYRAEIGGKIAAVGNRLLNGAARIIIGRFVAALGRRVGNEQPGLLSKLWRRR